MDAPDTLTLVSLRLMVECTSGSWLVGLVKTCFSFPEGNRCGGAAIRVRPVTLTGKFETVGVKPVGWAGFPN